VDISTLSLVRTIDALRTLRNDWQNQGYRVALVPTMGNLHEGHFTLVKAAKALADKVIVSIFVNPLQFGQNEDFDHYPRTLEQDVRALAILGVDAVFAPEAEALYPNRVTKSDEEASTSAVVPPVKLTSILCGKKRNGHFTGVATVVTKLFNLVQPHDALFGQKDYQQVTIIKQLVEDLNLPVNIIVCATARAEDGLALSSRNQYLTQKERIIAPRLYQTLLSMKDILQENPMNIDAVTKQAKATLLASGFDSVEYIDVRHPINLSSLTSVDEAGGVILAAAVLGKTRLIDNLVVEGKRLA
jgi:pantoate--beta-alanine ligase